MCVCVFSGGPAFWPRRLCAERRLHLLRLCGPVSVYRVWSSSATHGNTHIKTQHGSTLSVIFVVLYILHTPYQPCWTSALSLYLLSNRINRHCILILLESLFLQLVCAAVIQEEMKQQQDKEQCCSTPVGADTRPLSSSFVLHPLSIRLTDVLHNLLIPSS